MSNEVQPEHSVSTTTPKKWASTAGKIQTNKVQKALQDISWEGRTYTTLTGIVGGVEHRTSHTVICGAIRDDCRAALEEIAAKFDYKVTRENYPDIIAAVEDRLVALRASRPVKDERTTPEAEAERIAQHQAAEAERTRQEQEAKAKAESLAAELRRQYPWAVAQGERSSHSRVGQNMRIELANVFPAARFSVTTEYSRARVEWSFGPTEKQVKELTDKYLNSHWDGQTDRTVYDHTAEGEALSIVLGRIGYVSLSRRFPEETYERVGRMLCQLCGKEFVNMRQGDLREDDAPGDSLADHVYRLIARTSFPEGMRIKGVELLGELEAQDDVHAWCKLVLERDERPIAAAAVPVTGVSVRFNARKNGVEIMFPAKPSPEVLAPIKANGFRFSVNSRCWYKRFTNETWALAHRLVGLDCPPAAAAPPSAAGGDRFDMAVEDRMAEQCGLL